MSSEKQLIGASLSEPHTYEFAVCPPTLPVWIYIYIYICLYSIFRPTIWPTFSMSCAIVCLFEGRKYLQRRLGRPEEDVDALFETSDATFCSRRRLFRLSVRPL